MLCCKCHKNKVRYIAAQLCNGCYSTAKSLANLDKMIVRPCPGGCGKRVHNMAGLTVPGVTQGHGPKREWCCGCAKRIRPTAESKTLERGFCKHCNRPMMAGKRVKGFMPYKAKGLCSGCYNTYIYLSRRGINAGELNRAAKLQSGDVLEIRRLYAGGMRQPELAEMYNISHQNVSSIVTRASWKHLVDFV